MLLCTFPQALRKRLQRIDREAHAILDELGAWLKLRAASKACEHAAGCSAFFREETRDQGFYLLDRKSVV